MAAATAAGTRRRDQFLWLVLRVTQLFGVSNHLFDRKKQQLTYSSGAFVWRVSLHAASLIVLILNFKHIVEDTTENLSKSDFILDVAYTSIWINVAVIAHSLLSEWLSHGRGTKPLNELLSIRIENVLDSEAYDSVQRVTWNLLYVETLSMVLLTVTFVLTSLTQWKLSVRIIVCMVALDVLQLAHISIQYQFTTALLYGGYLFKVLNLRLAQLVADINAAPSLSHRRSLKLSAELARVGNCHTKLLRLLISIKDIYQVDIFVVLVALFTSLVCSVFFALVAYEGRLIQVTLSGYLIQCGNTIVATIALLITLYICEDCIRACDAGGEILRELRPSAVLHKSLQRDIETLCLQLSREKMRLTICGMFDLNINTGPVMIEGLYLKVILLTQIGYHDLHKQCIERGSLK